MRLERAPSKLKVRVFVSDVCMFFVVACVDAMRWTVQPDMQWQLPLSGHASTGARGFVGGP
jgi:hypothetical protein